MKPLLTALLGSALLLASGAEIAEAHGPRHNPSRHQHVMRHGVPKAYRELLNPPAHDVGKLRHWPTALRRELRCVSRNGRRG
jgi:hypothetical protein